MQWCGPRMSARDKHDIRIMCAEGYDAMAHLFVMPEDLEQHYVVRLGLLPVRQQIQLGDCCLLSGQ